MSFVRCFGAFDDFKHSLLYKWSVLVKPNRIKCLNFVVFRNQNVPSDHTFPEIYSVMLYGATTKVS